MVLTTILAVFCVGGGVLLKHIMDWRASKKYEKSYLRGLCALGDEILMNPSGYPFIIQHRSWEKLSRKT